MFKCIVLLCVLVSVLGKDADSRLVNTTQGPVRGYKAPGEDVFVFYGIPYATAPTSAQRFKAPLPPPQWIEPFDAVDKRIICPQRNNPLDPKTQQEDCLIANIYVPNTHADNLPVIVYVHGGAYQIGYGDFTKTKQLMKEKDVIVVNFNYRLGAHGFLCLGTPDVPGNAGMKDQVALLRWVKKNIANFGGNTDDITIIGYSAGSSAVDLLLLSPMTKGLFHKVIAESGANLAVFSVQIDPIETAGNIAKILNYTNKYNDIYALEEFYKSAPYELLNSVDVLSLPNSTFGFVPCVEHDVGEERFLDDSPLNILQKGRQQMLPMLYGFSEMEGLFRIPLFEYWKSAMNEKFTNFLPADLQFANNEEKEQVAEIVKKFYFGEKPVGEMTIFGYIDYYTDVIFAYATLKSVRLQVEAGNNNIYLYEYSFVDDNVPYIPHTKVRGANHCAQTWAVADGNFTTLQEETFTKDLKNMKKVMRKLWINFITTGKPVPEGSDLPEWPPVDVSGGPHMLLDKIIKLRGPLLQYRFHFWDDIYSRYYRSPIAPEALQP